MMNNIFIILEKFKRINIIFTTILFPVFTLYTEQGISQNGWFQQNSGTTYTLTGISFINPNTGFICGYQGIILKTTNGGTNWTQVSIPYNNYYDIIMLSESNIITGGVLPPVYRSSNSGLNWFNVDSSALTNIIFCNEQTGWISSTNILKTTNGGLNWNHYNLYNNRRPQGVYFADSLTGYAYGQNSGYPPPNPYINFVQKTTNGGMNWTEIISIYNSGSVLYGEIYFINAMTGFLGEWGKISKTDNGGINWREYDTPGWRLIEDIFFINPLTGWCVPDLAYTTNGGANWTSSLNGFFYKVFFINQNTGWVCGENGLIYKTTNGGTTNILQSLIQISSTFLLKQNYPNPFNPITNIKFDLPKSTDVRISVFDITGKEVAVLVNERLAAGTYATNWDASGFSSGVYFYKMSAGDFVETRKMMVVR